MVDKFSRVSVLICDVDGVLTDGSIIISPRGEEYKRFNTKDGSAIKYLIRSGVPVVFLTGRDSEAVKRRGEELGVELVVTGAKNKLEALNNVLRTLNLEPDQVCYIGDDLTDIPVLARVGCAVVVADSPREVKDVASYVTERDGGNGAVREVIELIMKSKGSWEEVLSRYGVGKCEEA